MTLLKIRLTFGLKKTGVFMKKLNNVSLILIGLVIYSFTVFAQQSPFDLNAYKLFLQTNQNATSAQLLQRHPAGMFLRNINQPLNDVLYLDTIYQKYYVTDYEKQLLQQNGFVVTERLAFTSHGKALADVFHKDLPVFVSADAILHTVHMSYDAILVEMEGQILIGKVIQMLNELASRQTALHNRYAGIPGMQISLEDYDVYITVARKLMGQNVTPFYTQNNVRIEELMNHINAEQFQYSYSIFGEPPHTVDFSQFKPRGHYADPENLIRYPLLDDYFKTLMWLGRVEICLLELNNNVYSSGIAVQRCVILASMVTEAANESNAKNLYIELNNIIELLVGKQDNVNLSNMEELLQAANITSSAQLLTPSKLFQFQDSLILRPFAFQRINSQLMLSNPFSPDIVMPASAFMLLGQRFIIDSYITAQVVFDRIIFNNTKMRRMLPSTLDVLFGLGNDAAGQLLKPEIDQWKYSTNLMALRYLIDGYDDSFWNENLFHQWLNGIRKLNPPAESARGNLPLFMQSAAYWQQKMNTQLTSWTELRHDNLLYAKQSYTSGWICSYPFSYVEPFPDFYRSVSSYALKLKQLVEPLQFTHTAIKSQILAYSNNLKSVSDTLAIISEKELSNTQLNLAEINFLKSMLRRASGGCGIDYDGWFLELFLYRDMQFQKEDLICADIHTSGQDENGNNVGWVKHSGTGKINMGVFVVPNNVGQLIAYIGPVGSYHEFTTNGFLRLTDEEWKSTYLALSSRPNWVNTYLANSQGGSRGAGPSLITSIDDEGQNNNLVNDFILHQNYPNPFNASTLIQFTVPINTNPSITVLEVFDMQGRRVKQLLNEFLSAGTYVVRWDGTNQINETLPSGVYFYRIQSNGHKNIGKIMMLK